MSAHKTRIPAALRCLLPCTIHPNRTYCNVLTTHTCLCLFPLQGLGMLASIGAAEQSYNVCQSHHASIRLSCVNQPAFALRHRGCPSCTDLLSSNLSLFAALGMFLLYSAYSRTGKLNATSGVLHLMSFLCDIIILSVYGDTWAVEKRAYAFSLTVIIVNLFVKAVALLVIVLIYGHVGNSRLPLSYHTVAYTQPTVHPSYYPSNVDETTGLNDTSIAAAEEGVARWGEKGGGASGEHGGPVGYGMYGSGGGGVGFVDSYQADSFNQSRTSL